MKYKKDTFRNISLITQLGLSMMVPVFLCVFVGIVIDNKFNSQTTLAFLILGIIAGCRNTYRLAMNAAEYDSSPKKKPELGKDSQIEEEKNEK
ncbi:MAG: AtpZ/AtpI family protein [Eubacterium sp.]